MATSLNSTAATPRGFTLAVLVLLVLGVHLAVLSGGLSAFPPAPLEHPAASPRVAAVLTRTLAPSAGSPSAPAPPVTGGTARWITAAREPASAPAPTRSTPEQPRQAQHLRPPKPAAPPMEPAAPAASPDTPVDVPAADLQGSNAREPADVALATPADATEVVTTAKEAPSSREATVPAEPSPASQQPVPTPRPAHAEGAATAAPSSVHSSLQPPASPPASAQLNYKVTGSIKGALYNASARLDWNQDGGRYDARMEVRLFLLGSRVQTSTGRTNEHGLLPERFSDKSRSERAAHFDHARQQIRFSANTPEVDLQPGAQDRLSVFLQLAALLNARPDGFRPGQTIALQVAGTGGADIWRFQVGEVEPLSLPAGDLPALHLVREPREEYDTRVDVWLAPGLAYLPVRLRITQRSGDSVDQQLSELP